MDSAEPYDLDPEAIDTSLAEERPDDLDLDEEPEPVTIGASSEEADATRADWQDDSDPHAVEAKQLGFRLVWWDDTSFVAAEAAMGKLLGGLLESRDELRELYNHGLPVGLIQADWHLTQETAPLVLAGLQLLGIFAPELREELAGMMHDLPVPVPTDEEKQIIADAMNGLYEERAEKQRAFFERLVGAPRGSAEAVPDMPTMPDEPAPSDADLN